MPDQYLSENVFDGTRKRDAEQSLRDYDRALRSLARIGFTASEFGKACAKVQELRVVVRDGNRKAIEP
jgi:hypothetical protein